eukprot:scaffold9921_cov112-Isochrysis_galbana.AAC.10
MAAMPRNTPVIEPRSELFTSQAPWREAYPHSSSNRCCGSIAPASAGDKPKKVLSNSSASVKKAPCRMRCCMTRLVESATAMDHRSNGTSEVKSYPQDAIQPSK